MARKLVVMLAAGALLAMPAMAEFQYTPIDMVGANTIGIYHDGVLNDLYITSDSGLPQSATFVVTFGIHLDNAPIFAYGAYPHRSHYLHFNFLYDSSSLEVVHANHLAPWMNSNYGSQAGIWPVATASPWTTGLTTLQQYNITTPTGQYYDPVDMFQSSIFPFFQATLHVNSAVASQLNWFGITVMTIPNSYYGVSPGDLDLTPGMFQYGEGWVHEVPEPSSMVGLIGLALVAGGLVRRWRS